MKKGKWIKKTIAIFLFLAMTATSMLGYFSFRQSALPVQAATTTHKVDISCANALPSKRGTGTVELSELESPFGISAIGKSNDHSLWDIRVNGHRVFCSNGDKSLCTGDRVKWTSTKATKFSDQSIAKALTYFYYEKGGNATAKEQGMLQAFIWACGKGVNKLTAMKQAATHFSGGVSASDMYDAIKETDPRGYVCSARVTKCAKGKNRSSHQVLLGWFGEETWKEAEVQLTSTVSYNPQAKFTVEKKTKSGDLITSSNAKFEVYLEEVNDPIAILETNGGKVDVNISLGNWLYKEETVTTQRYRYAKDWESMSTEARKDAREKGISYKSKEAAKKDANKELEALKEQKKAAWKKTQFHMTVKEVTAPKGFTISTEASKNITLTTEVSQTVSFVDEEYFGEIVIKKTDIAGNPIEGTAVFRLRAASNIYKYTKGKEELAYKSGDVVMDNIPVNGKINDGTVTIENLYLGSYVVEEVQAPRGYQLNTQVFSVTLSESDLSGTCTCVNEKESRSSANYLSLYKKKNIAGVKDSTLAESGAQFTILRASAVNHEQIAFLNAAEEEERKAFIATLSPNDIFGTITTDAEGFGEYDLIDPTKAEDDNSPLDEFLIVQTKGEENYNLTKVICSTDSMIKKEQNKETVNGTEMEVTHYYMEEEDAPVDSGEPPFIILHKEKRTSQGDTPEEGAKFEVLDGKTGKALKLTKADGTTLKVLTTGEDGNTEAVYLMPGTYTIHQIDGDAKYLFMEDTQVTVTEEMKNEYKETKEPITLGNYVNLPGPPSLKLVKKSAETDAPVNGAVYTVTDANGNTVGTITTGDEGVDGETMIKLPKYGSYVVQEKTTPKGFALDTKPYTCEILEDTCQFDQDGNACFTLEVTDPPIYGEISLSKSANIVSGYSSEEKGFKYEKDEFFPGAVYALYAGEDIKKDNGDLVWNADEEIARLTTGDTKALKFVNPKADTARKMETTDFWLGSYYMKEISVPEGYTLDTARHDIVLTDKGLVDDAVYQTDLEEKTGPFGNNGVKVTTGKYVLETGQIFNDRFQGTGVTEISFVYDNAPAEVSITDVSQDKDGSVVMWNQGTKYYISTQTKEQETEQFVYFNADSSHMFEGLYTLQKVSFDAAMTTYMVDASYMFAECTMIMELDLSPFSTERMQYTGYMFYNCHSLTTILVFDRSLILDEAYSPNPIYITATPNRIFGLPGMTEEDVDGNGSKIPEEDEYIDAEDFTFIVHYDDNTEEELDVDVESAVFLTKAVKNSNPVTEPTSSNPAMVDYPKAYLANPDSANAGEDSAITTTGKKTLYIRNIKVNDQDHPGTVLDYREYSHTENNLLWNDGVEVTINVIDPESESNASQVPKAHVDMEMSNAKTILNVVVKKEDAEDGKNLGGAVIGLYANTDIYGSDGREIFASGDLIKKVETSDSTAFSGISFGDLPVIPGVKDAYYVQEITPPLGYKINNQKIIVDSAADTKDGQTIEITQRSYSIKDEPNEYVSLYKYWNRNDLISKSSGGTGRAVDVKVHVNVLENGIKIGEVVLSKENNWREVFDGNGQIKGLVIRGSDMYPKEIYSFEEVIPEDGSYKEVSKSYSQDLKVYTISNKFDTTSATIEKSFVDQDNKDGIRPTQVNVTLIGSNGKLYGQLLLSKANEWSGTIRNLPTKDADGNEITYHWEERYTIPEVTLGDPVKGYISVCYTDEEDKTITYMENWHGLTSRTLKKIWNDNNNAEKRRPEYVDAVLYADGEPAKDYNGKDVSRVRLNASNSWQITVDNLPIVNNSKKEITYSWKEVTVADNVTNTGEDGYSERTILHFNDPHFPMMGTTGVGYGYSNKMETDANDSRITLLTNTKEEDELGKITITKKIRPDVVLNSELYPTFKFVLTGTTVYGESVGPVEKTVTFSKEEVKKLKEGLTGENGKYDDYVSLSVAFEHLIYGEYYVKESGMDPCYYADDVVDTVSAEVSADKNEVKFFLEKDHPACGATFVNEPTLGGFRIMKYDTDGKTPLNDVEFIIKSPYGEIYKVVSGTGLDGEAKIEDLLPGTYTVTEIKTSTGKSLLTEPFEVKLPLQLSGEEVKASNIDVSKGKLDKETGIYYFYDLSYEVTNYETLKMPMTGAMDTFLTYLPLLAAFILVMSGGIVYYGKKKK